MRPDEQHVERPKRRLWPSVESLEGRALLSSFPSVTRGSPGYGPGGPSPTPTPTSAPAPMPILAPTPSPSTTQTPAPTPGSVVTLPRSGYASTPPPATPPRRTHAVLKATGLVTKTPSFYSFYTGPQWAELNAVKASGKLAGRNFAFTGTNQGKIDQAPAVYVWGVDRNGHLPPGPFPNRPSVTFDALIVVRLDSSLTPTAQVLDLASGATTNLPASAVRIHGATIRLKVPASLLPSTGLPLAQYRFSYWPADGGAGPSSIASFAPEFTDAQVGTS